MYGDTMSLKPLNGSLLLPSLEQRIVLRIQMEKDSRFVRGTTFQPHHSNSSWDIAFNS
jgi:hypothetical protein